MIGFVNRSGSSKGSFTLGAHLGKDMAFEGVLPFNLSGAGI